MRALVPREWSPDEALLAVSLLRQAMDAVWAVHGEEMAAELADDRYRDRVGDYVELEEPDTDLDDIPF